MLGYKIVNTNFDDKSDLVLEKLQPKNIWCYVTSFFGNIITPFIILLNCYYILSTKLLNAFKRPNEVDNKNT